MKTRLDETNKMRKLMGLNLLTESENEKNCLSEHMKGFLKKYGYEPTERFKTPTESNVQEPGLSSRTFSPQYSICYVQKKPCKVTKKRITRADGTNVELFSKIHLEFFDFTPECSEEYDAVRIVDVAIITELIDKEGNYRGASANVEPTRLIDDERGPWYIQEAFKDPEYKLNGVNPYCM